MSFDGLSLQSALALPIAISAFVVLLTIIVFFHEYGHFSMARLLGVRVDVFSIGFGKPIARWVDRQGTEWRIAMLPLGGFVKFFGDASPTSEASRRVSDEKAQGDHPATTQFPRPGHEDEIGGRLTAEERKVCFHFKPVWARALIVAAGPFANFVLATVIFWGILLAFGKVVWEPKVGEVLAGSAAEEAGFRTGDLIVSVDGRALRRFEDLAMTTRLSAGDPLRFVINRDGENLTIIATPRREEIEDGCGAKATTGVLGLRSDQDSYTHVTFTPASAFLPAVAKVGEVIGATVRFLGRLVQGKEDARQLGGPIKMAQCAGASAASGFEEAQGPALTFGESLKVSLANFINLAALVSVSIGFLNLLPVPVLDGGHLLYYAYEASVGKPLGVRAQAVGFRLGIVLLATFMLYVTWNDIGNLLSSFT